MLTELTVLEPQRLLPRLIFAPPKQSFINNYPSLLSSIHNPNLSSLHQGKKKWYHFQTEDIEKEESEKEIVHGDEPSRHVPSSY